MFKEQNKTKQKNLGTEWRVTAGTHNGTNVFVKNDFYYLARSACKIHFYTSWCTNFSYLRLETSVWYLQYLWSVACPTYKYMLFPQLAAYIYGKPNMTWTQHDGWWGASRGPTFNKPHLCLIKALPFYLWVSVNTGGRLGLRKEWLSLYRTRITVAHVLRFTWNPSKVCRREQQVHI